MAETQNDVFTKSVCLAVSFSRWGLKRTVDINAIETGNSDKKLLHLDKSILDKQSLKEVCSLDTQVVQYLRNRCLRLPFELGRSIFLLPTALLEPVDSYLQEKIRQRKELIEEFLKEYPEEVNRARARLGVLFRDADYPTVEALRQQFAFSYRYVSFNTPENLEAVSSSIFQREREKAAKAWSTALDEIRLTLRASLNDLINHLIEQLAGVDGGKSKSFRIKSLTKIEDFIQTFEARNITNDGELMNLVGDVKKLVSGVDPGSVRKSDSVRETVTKGFKDISGKLDAMLIDRPSRVIKLTD